MSMPLLSLAGTRATAPRFPAHQCLQAPRRRGLQDLPRPRRPPSAVPALPRAPPSWLSGPVHSQCHLPLTGHNRLNSEMLRAAGENCPGRPLPPSKADLDPLKMGVPQLVPTLPTPRKYRRTSLRLMDAQRTCAPDLALTPTSLWSPQHIGMPQPAPSGPPLVSPGNRPPHPGSSVPGPLHALQVLSIQPAATTATVIITVPLSPRTILPRTTCPRSPV